MPVYTNAADVLPPELLTEVQKRWQGLLYVPPPERRNKTDSELVFNLINGGCTAGEAAMVVGVTRRRVYQIAGKLGMENPFSRTKPRQQKPELMPEPSVKAPGDAQKAP